MSKYTPSISHPELPFEEIPYGYCHCGCGQKTNIAKSNHHRSGHVKGHPVRFIMGHTLSRPTLSLEAAFWQYVTLGEPKDCWEWNGHKGSTGYGRLTFHYADLSAHRISYELHYGQIPEGELVCHECDNPPCCNPKHLFAGSIQDNHADMVAKKRHAFGTKIGAARFTIKDVKQVRLLADQGISITDIAKRFNASRSGVSQIVNRKTWKHVP